MLQNGVCVSESIAPSWQSAQLIEKVSRVMGYRSDSIAISLDLGALRQHVLEGDKPDTAKHFALANH